MKLMRTGLILFLLLFSSLNVAAYPVIDVDGFSWRDPIPEPVIVVPPPVIKPPVVVKPPVVTYKNYKGLVSVDNMYNTIAALSASDDARVAGTLGEKQAGDLLQRMLEESAYTVTRQIFNMNIKNPDKTVGDAAQSTNVFALPANYNTNRKTILLVAHHDSVYTPGANDNASGAAMIVEMARYLATRSDLKYNIAILLTGTEENKHAGAKHFVANPLIPLSSIALVLNFDMVGAGSYYEIFNYRSSMSAKYYPKFALKVAKSFGLKAVQKLTQYSDHKEFEEKDIDSVTFMNLASYPYYHKDTDTIGRISKTTLRNISNIALNVIEELNKH